MKNGFTGVIVFFTLLFALLPGCLQDEPSPDAPSDLRFEVKIQDSSPKSLVLKRDGTLEFWDNKLVKSTKLTKPEVQALRARIFDSGFFDLNDRYEGSKCCDFIAHTITVHTTERTKSVYCYNECPGEFDSVRKLLMESWPEKIVYNGWA